MTVLLFFGSLVQRYVFWHHSEILVLLKLCHNTRLLNAVRLEKSILSAISNFIELLETTRCISRSCKPLHILLFPYRAYLHNQPVVFFPRLENWACIWSFCTLQDVNRMIVFPIKSQKPVKCEWDWVFNCWAYSNNFYWK